MLSHKTILLSSALYALFCEQGLDTVYSIQEGKDLPDNVVIYEDGLSLDQIIEDEIKYLDLKVEKAYKDYDHLFFHHKHYDDNTLHNNNLHRGRPQQKQKGLKFTDTNKFQHR